MSTQSIDTALAALEELALAGPLGLSDLARRRAVSKATLLRHLTTMRSRGWVDQLPTPDSRWVYVGFESSAAGGEHAEAWRRSVLAIMTELQGRTTETVHYCERLGAWLTLKERVDSSHALRTYYPMGHRLAFHASASGLAYLAALPDEVAGELLHPPLTAVTSSTMTDPEEVMDAVRAARHRGYSINLGGSKQEVSSVGAAILGADGGPVGTLSVSGAATRFSQDHMSDAGQALKEAVRRLAPRGA